MLSNLRECRDTLTQSLKVFSGPDRPAEERVAIWAQLATVEAMIEEMEHPGE